MLDRIHLFVPFKCEHVRLLGVDGRKEPIHLVELDLLMKKGVPLSAGQVQRDEHGNLQADDLRHKWESLSTGFTPMAFKVFHESLGKRVMPGVEMKASPAKLLQGHNVFGPTDILHGAYEMLRWLEVAYPNLFDMLDIPEAEVYDIDCTYSARMPNERSALQAIAAIAGVSNGQTKARGDNYTTTAYFGAKDSRLRKLKLYLKNDEFHSALAEAKALARGKGKPFLHYLREPIRPIERKPLTPQQLAYMLNRASRLNLSAHRTVKVMSDPRLLEWVKNLLRVEASVSKRWLNRRGIPSRLFDLARVQRWLLDHGTCLIEWCWAQVTRELFKAFEGMTMRVIDDESVLKALLEKWTKPGKVRMTKPRVEAGVDVPAIAIQGKPSDAYARNLFRTFRSIREFGWEETMESMSRASFYRHVADIQACGISKAALQKLNCDHGPNNVVPLLRFLQIDFAAQRPDWYQLPRVA